MPRVSAAWGFSPHERRRRPNEVRHSTHAVTATRTNASTVSSESRVVTPAMAPATSETTNQFRSARDRAPSATSGTVNSGGVE